VRLAWSKDPVGSTGRSVATGRVSHAGQIESEDPDEKTYPSSAERGLGMRLQKKFSNTHMRDDSSGHKTIRR